MQQATVNLFADMGAQPATLQAGLVAATASTDTTPPTSTITSPGSRGDASTRGQAVTITGTASGRRRAWSAAVEVSTDGGATWHPANGRASVDATPGRRAAGRADARSRAAIDDSGNLETRRQRARPSRSAGQDAARARIWSDSTTPADGSSDPTRRPIELGVKFRTDVDGFVTGLRFYKGSANTGTHVGHLWTTRRDAARRGDVHRRERRAAGRRSRFATPVAITREHDLRRVVPRAGRAATRADSGYFADSAVDNPPLHALGRRRRRPQRRLRVRRERLVPRPDVNADELLGRRRLRDGRRARTRPPPTVSPSSPGDRARRASPPSAERHGRRSARRSPQSTHRRATSSSATGRRALVAGGGDLRRGDPHARRSTRPRRWLRSHDLHGDGHGRPSGVTDAAGNALRPTTTWSFTTAAPPPRRRPRARAGRSSSSAARRTRSAATTRRSSAPKG